MTHDFKHNSVVKDVEEALACTNAGLASVRIELNEVYDYSITEINLINNVSPNKSF